MIENDGILNIILGELTEGLKIIDNRLLTAKVASMEELRYNQGQREVLVKIKDRMIELNKEGK